MTTETVLRALDGSFSIGLGRRIRLSMVCSMIVFTSGGKLSTMGRQFQHNLTIFLWLPYANIFTTGPPVFVNSPFRLGKITNCSVETVSRHFSFL